ncbi:MAG: hypothetical protein EBT42_03960 [Actinobacteria bacterium]|nr:hypothetical protein [Actinomycetota bacterium]
MRRGRGSETSACPVKVAAQEMGLKVTHSLGDAVALVNPSNDLLGVVVAYGELISMDVLSVVPMINVHFSLLPRWRGAAPVERAILGEVFSRTEMPILSTDTLVSLRQKLLLASLPLLVTAVKNGFGQGVAQSGEALYAKKILSSELQIDWSNSATQIDRLIRVGGAYTHIGGKRLKIVKAKIVADSMTNASYGAIKLVSRHECAVATGSGMISLIEVQPEGKAAMKVDGWLNGARIETGAVFG